MPWWVWSHTNYSDKLNIVNQNHPVITGEGWWEEIKDSNYFDWWNNSTHWYFYDLPDEYHTIITDNKDRPVYIEYNLWKWKVLATKQTVEWWYGNRWKTEFLKNKLIYIKNYDPDEIDYESLSLNPKPQDEKLALAWAYYWQWDNQIRIDNNIDILKENDVKENHEWDPVDIRTWWFGYKNIFFHIPWEGMDYNLDLVYESRTFFNWPVWVNWDHNYNIYLIEDDDQISFYNWKLWASKFTLDENWEAYNELINAQLVKDNGTYQINFDNWKTYKFGDNNKINTIIDKNWNELNFQYNEDDQLTQLIDTLWREIDYNYNENDRLSEVIDFNQNSIEFTYYGEDEEGGNKYDLKKITLNKDWESKDIVFEYDSGKDDIYLNHNLTKLIDSEWQVYVENSYNEDNRVEYQIFGNWKIEYDYEVDDWRVVKNNITDRRWNKAEYSFDEMWNVLERKVFTEDWTASYQYEYNDKGQVIKEIFPKGNGISYAYNDKWQLIEERHKENINTEDSNDDLVTKYEYKSEFDIPTKIIHPNWLVIENTLDEKWNITKSVQKWDWNKLITSYEYDNNWNLIKQIDPEWNITQFEYINWQISKILRGSWDDRIVNEFIYDDYGNVVQILDWNGNKTNLDYDWFINLIESTSPEWVVNQFEYDKNNNLLSEKIIGEDWEKLLSENEYDLLDNPVKTITYQNVNKANASEIKYDWNENITKIIYPNGLIQEFEYNQFDNITKITETGDSNQRVVEFKYDKNQNLIKEVVDWVKTEYDYDGFDRLVSIERWNKVTEYEYNELWQPTKISNNEYEQRIEYNDFGLATTIVESWKVKTNLNLDYLPWSNIPRLRVMFNNTPQDRKDGKDFILNTLFDKKHIYSLIMLWSWNSKKIRKMELDNLEKLNLLQFFSESIDKRIERLETNLFWHIFVNNISKKEAVFLSDISINDDSWDLIPNMLFSNSLIFLFDDKLDFLVNVYSYWMNRCCFIWQGIFIQIER